MTDTNTTERKGTAHETDADEIIQYACEHVDRAVEATANANPQADIDDIGDLYEFVAGVDDMPTYEVEIELHEFELMQFMQGLMEGLDRMQHADELAFKSNMIAKLAAACPEHFDRLSELGDQVNDDRSRGFQ